jgi:pimeloyl-ACP methyl ester carboxylesterase
VRTSDGLDLAGYYWPGAPGDRDIVIFFHGRNWNAEMGANFARHLVGAGNAVMVASYRGFGDNPGSPSEAGILRDAAAFIAEARVRSGPDAHIWLVGHSIGAAVALHAAAQDRHVAGVIAMSAFERVAQAAPRLARAFVPDRWNNLAALKSLAIPVIFIQGGLDRFIPAGSGDDLFSAYHGPSSLVMGESSRHNPDMTILGPWITQAIDTMQAGTLASLPAPPHGWIEKVRRP